MPDDLRQRCARLENEQGRLWDIVDQVHLGPVSPDKDLVEAVADTIKQVAEAWRERAEKAEVELETAHRELAEAKAAIARVRRLCRITIDASCRVQAIDQARDTLTVLDLPPEPR